MSAGLSADLQMAQCTVRSKHKRDNSLSPALSDCDLSYVMPSLPHHFNSPLSPLHASAGVQFLSLTALLTSKHSVSNALIDFLQQGQDHSNILAM